MQQQRAMMMSTVWTDTGDHAEVHAGVQGVQAQATVRGSVCGQGLCKVPWPVLSLKAM